MFSEVPTTYTATSINAVKAMITPCMTQTLPIIIRKSVRFFPRFMFVL